MDTDYRTTEHSRVLVLGFIIQRNSFLLTIPRRQGRFVHQEQLIPDILQIMTSLQTETNDKRVKSVQSEVETLKSLVKCPICLETMINPVRTKCDHGFCRLCLETWISEKGKRGKVGCPSCQAGGVTKRSLTEDVVMGKLVLQIR